MRETKRVAVIMHPVRTYCRRIMLGVASVSAQARWECILIPTDAPSPVVHLDGFVHGLIGHFSETDLAERVKRAGLPAVDISPAQREGHLLPRVSTDDIAVGRLAARAPALPGAAALRASSGRGRTTFHSSARRGSRTRSRPRACRATCCWTPPPTAPTSPRGRWRRGCAVLPKPIGVLASTDSRALQLLAMCRKTGMAVPKSVAVLGVDNDDVFCELANPPLSSIALSTRRIGYEAARMLDRLMAGEKPANGQLLVPPAGVVPRRSSDVPAILDPDVAAAVRYISLHVQDDLQVADVLREVHDVAPLPGTAVPQGAGPDARRRDPPRRWRWPGRCWPRPTSRWPRVALAAGFSNAKQLGSGFHHETGVTPTAYRRQSRGG